MQEPQVISVWRKDRAAGLYVNFHHHKYHELVYYPAGNGLTRIGDRDYSFGDHSFAVIPGGLVHDERHHRAGRVICLEFFCEGTLQPALHRDPSGAILHLLKGLLEEVRDQNYGYREMLSLKLRELLLQIERNQKTEAGQKNFDYMINFLRENFHERIMLADCAAQMNISYDYFQHKFKALTGVSPRRFLLECRLNAARELLLSGNRNCTEIAYQCGFSTSAQFSALFKAHFGQSPLQYRNAK